MPSPKRISLALLCPLLLLGCQQLSLTDEPDGTGSTEQDATPTSIAGTGVGSRELPLTAADVRAMTTESGEPVWVIGYLVGTARQTMNNAVFSPETDNQSNILISSDSLCTDTARCIAVELASAKYKALLSLPTNVAHFHQCVLLRGIPSRYLNNRKGLRSISAGLWLDGFDIASVAPLEWGSIKI